MSKWKLEFFMLFIMSQIGMQIAGILFYPVYFWAIILGTIIYIEWIIIQAKRIIKKGSKSPVTVLEAETIKDKMFSIFVDQNNKRLLQIAFNDAKGDHFWTIDLTMKNYKKLKRDQTDIKTIFENASIFSYMHNSKNQFITALDRNILPEAGLNPFKNKKFHRTERSRLQKILDYFKR